MKQIEKVKNEKPEEFKSKAKFLEDAVNEKLKRIRDDDMRYNFTAIQEFLQKNAVTLRRKGINSMLELASTTLTNTEDIKRLEAKIEDYKQTTKEMIATFGDQWEIPTHEEMKKILKEMDEIEDKQILEAKRFSKQS